MTRCAYCDKPAIAVLDGEGRCIEHGRAWLRGEADAAREAEPVADARGNPL